MEGSECGGSPTLITAGSQGFLSQSQRLNSKAVEQHSTTYVHDSFVAPNAFSLLLLNIHHTQYCHPTVDNTDAVTRCNVIPALQQTIVVNCKTAIVWGGLYTFQILI